MEFKKESLYTYDGSKGTMFMLNGYTGLPEALSQTNPDVVSELAGSYVQAGCDLIQTNTFNANGNSLKKYGLSDKQKELIEKSINIAKRAASANPGCSVVFSIGPTGRLMEPSGDLTYDEAYEIYSAMEGYALDYGADIFQFETFTDLYEIKIAIIALKDLCDKRDIKVTVMSSLSFEENERTLMGNTPVQCAEMLTRLGVDVLGSNCGFGGNKMVSVIRQMASCTDLPVLAKPNAGLPVNVDGKVVYTQSPEDFAKDCVNLVNAGANIIGGCCGTTPKHIAEMIKVLKDTPVAVTSTVEIKERVYEAPAFICPEDWDEGSLYDLAYDSLDNENDLVCLWGDKGIDIAKAIGVVYGVTKADTAAYCSDAHELEESIKRAPVLPDIWLPKGVSLTDNIQILADKYNLRILKEDNFNG